MHISILLSTLASTALVISLASWMLLRPSKWAQDDKDLAVKAPKQSVLVAGVVLLALLLLGLGNPPEPQYLYALLVAPLFSYVAWLSLFTDVKKRLVDMRGQYSFLVVSALAAFALLRAPEHQPFLVATMVMTLLFLGLGLVVSESIMGAADWRALAMLPPLFIPSGTIHVIHWALVLFFLLALGYTVRFVWLEWKSAPPEERKSFWRMLLSQKVSIPAVPLILLPSVVVFLGGCASILL